MPTQNQKTHFIERLIELSRAGEIDWDDEYPDRFVQLSNDYTLVVERVRMSIDPLAEYAKVVVLDTTGDGALHIGLGEVPYTLLVELLEVVCVEPTPLIDLDEVLDALENPPQNFGADEQLQLKPIPAHEPEPTHGSSNSDITRLAALFRERQNHE